MFGLKIRFELTENNTTMRCKYKTKKKCFTHYVVTTAQVPEHRIIKITGINQIIIFYYGKIT